MPRTRPSSSLRHSPPPSLTWTSSWHRSPAPRRLPDGNRRSVDHPSPSGGSSDRRYTPGCNRWAAADRAVACAHTRPIADLDRLPDHLSVDARRRRVEHDGSTCRAPRMWSYRASMRPRNPDRRSRPPCADPRHPRHTCLSARRARRISASGPLERGTLRQARTARPWKRGERIARGVRLSRRTGITDRHNATPAMIESSSGSS